MSLRNGIPHKRSVLTERVSARHHRARLLNAKRISGKSAAELAEVLGVAPTVSNSQSTTPSSSPGALTPISDPIEDDTKVQTSTTTVSDYFREKMMKMQGKHKWMKDDVASAVGSSSLAQSVVESREGEDNDNDSQRPRIGLGARPSATSTEISDLRFTSGQGLGFKPATSSKLSAEAYPSALPSPTTSQHSGPAIPGSGHREKPTTTNKDKKRRDKGKGVEDPSFTSVINGTLSPEDVKAERKRRKREEKARQKETTAPPPSSTGIDGDSAIETLTKKPKESDTEVIIPVNQVESLKEAKRKRKEEKRARKAAAVVS